MQMKCVLLPQDTQYDYHPFPHHILINITPWQWGLRKQIPFEPPRDKTNIVTVCPAKTQISLGIRPVWSESSLCTQWAAKDLSFLHADSEDWSDWADAQADLSLRWAHSHFVGFVMRQLISNLYELHPEISN